MKMYLLLKLSCIYFKPFFHLSFRGEYNLKIAASFEGIGIGIASQGLNHPIDVDLDPPRVSNFRRPLGGWARRTWIRGDRITPQIYKP